MMKTAVAFLVKTSKRRRPTASTKTARSRKSNVRDREWKRHEAAVTRSHTLKSESESPNTDTGANKLHQDRYKKSSLYAMEITSLKVWQRKQFPFTVAPNSSNYPGLRMTRKCISSMYCILYYYTYILYTLLYISVISVHIYYINKEWWIKGKW